MISKSIDNRVKLRLGYFFLRVDFGLGLKKKTGNLGVFRRHVVYVETGIWLWGLCVREMG